MTLSAEQLAFAQQRLRNRRSVWALDLRLQDYRDVRGAFDRIVSIEMLEAVGRPTGRHTSRNCGTACARAGQLCCRLSRSMTLGLKTIAEGPTSSRNTSSPVACSRRREFIEREIAKAGLQLVANEFFGESYARTLEEWRLRFQ